jgi:hypothetical protein
VQLEDQILVAIICREEHCGQENGDASAKKKRSVACGLIKLQNLGMKQEFQLDVYTFSNISDT